MTAVDGTGMAMSDSARIQLSIFPKSQVTVEPKKSEVPSLKIWTANRKALGSSVGYVLAAASSK